MSRTSSAAVAAAAAIAAQRSSSSSAITSATPHVNGFAHVNGYALHEDSTAPSGVDNHDDLTSGGASHEANGTDGVELELRHGFGDASAAYSEEELKGGYFLYWTEVRAHCLFASCLDAAVGTTIASFYLTSL